MEEYYGNNDWRDYLAHYGVKGMKWRHHKYSNDRYDQLTKGPERRKAYENQKYMARQLATDYTSDGTDSGIRSKYKGKEDRVMNTMYRYDNRIESLRREDARLKGKRGKSAYNKKQKKYGKSVFYEYLNKASTPKRRYRNYGTPND